MFLLMIIRISKQSILYGIHTPWISDNGLPMDTSQEDHQVLTDEEIDKLLRCEPITPHWPWGSRDELVIDNNIRDILAEVCRKLQLKDQTHYDHYGSGYASFVDCWLYRPTDEFRICPGDCYEGLVVLFSRFSPYYVLGQGERSWGESARCSYLPHYEFVDDIDHPAVVGLVSKVTEILDVRCLKRLHQFDLSPALQRNQRIPTNLSDKFYRHFDALFYWED